MAQSDKQKVALASVVAQAWQDTGYKEKLISDPAAVLGDAGVSVPSGAKPVVVQNTDRDVHIVVPGADDFEASRADFIKGLGHLLPLPDGVRLHFVQNTGDTHHVVLPLAPDTSNLSDDDVMNLAAAGPQSVNVNVGGVNAGIEFQSVVVNVGTSAVNTNIAVVAIVAT